MAKVEAPKVDEPKDVSPPINGPPVVAPAAAEIPSFSFEGGAAVETGSGVDVYKGLLQYAFTSKWKKPDDVDDQKFVAEVDVSVARDGKISNPQWVKKSGDKRQDDSVQPFSRFLTWILPHRPIFPRTWSFVSTWSNKPIR